MKRFLSILLAVGLSVPVGADVLVYNYKAVGIEHTCESGQWGLNKVNDKAYEIVNADVNKVNIWKVNTRREKTINGTLKFAEAACAGEFDFIEMPTDENPFWIISGISNDNEKTLMTGQAKPTKIGSVILEAPAKLSGNSIWDNNSENIRHVGYSGVSMRLNKNMTADVRMLNAEEAAEQTIRYLVENRGYVDCNACPCLCSAKWAVELPMITPRKYFAASAIDGKIYVFGGYNNGTYLKSTEVYDTAANQWAGLADNNQGVVGITSAAVNGKFYVFGAWNGRNTINFNQMYDPVTNTWTTLAPKPTEVFDAVTAVYNGQIYLFGGGRNNGNSTAYSQAVECYNPADDSWRFVTDIPELLGFFTIATVGNKAFLFGGTDLSSHDWNTSDDIISYDFETGLWDNTGFAHLPREQNFWTGSAAPVIDGRIYLIGGENLNFSVGDLIGDIELNITYGADIYILSDNTWQKAPFLPVKLYDYAISAVDRKIYVLGGHTRNSSFSRNEVYSFDTSLCFP